MFSATEIIGQALRKDEPVKLLALGDSYTIGEAVAESQRWPVQLVSALMLRGYTCHKPEFIAATGWRTDELRKAIEERNPAKDFSLVSLLIGVNNQYQGKELADYKKDFAELLRVAIEHAGGNKSHVFVLSIPDYGFTPFGEADREAIAEQINAFNAANETITREMGVRYIDITDISRRGLAHPELIADDGLHPSGKMYALWVERILERLL